VEEDGGGRDEDDSKLSLVMTSSAMPGSDRDQEVVQEATPGVMPLSDHKDPGPSADSTQTAGTSDTIAAQDNGPTGDIANVWFEVSVRTGSEDTRDWICSLVTPTDWEICNTMPYQFLEGVMKNKANKVFLGRLRGGEACSIFSYCDSGRGLMDKTVSLLWTKSSHRRKGFAKCVINEGIGFILDNATMNSGTNPTTQSRGLYQHLEFKRNDVGYSIVVEKLRETLEQRGC
jgi:hypothetical protein